MGGHDDGDFGPAYWEQRYRDGGATGRHDPSPSLITEVSDLPPGSALDAGCGWGADALWLAARGWSVVAVDVAPEALEQAKAAAEAAAPDAATCIHWVPADLTTWEPGTQFDLVTCHYVHVPGPPEVLFARLATWVAPGGTLLVVGHGCTPGHHGELQGGAHEPAAAAKIRPLQITSVLPADDWDVLVAESRTHLPRPDGTAPAASQDVIVRAIRKHPPRH